MSTPANPLPRDATSDSSTPLSPFKHEAFPGTYALILKLQSPLTARVGRLGELTFPAGLYLYIGSALGSGGLPARLARHARQDAKMRPHWHIDTLLGPGSIEAVWWAAGSERRECAWVRVLGDTGIQIVRDFGSSDCRCPGHLFRPDGEETLGRAWNVLWLHVPQGLKRWSPTVVKREES